MRKRSDREIKIRNALVKFKHKSINYMHTGKLIIGLKFVARRHKNLRGSHIRESFRALCASRAFGAMLWLNKWKFRSSFVCITQYSPHVHSLIIQHSRFNICWSNIWARNLMRLTLHCQQKKKTKRRNITWRYIVMQEENINNAQMFLHEKWVSRWIC